MTRPPRFENAEDAAQFLLEHGDIGHFLTVEQFSRFVEFLAETADGDASLPAILLEFFRGEIERFDEIVSGGNE